MDDTFAITTGISLLDKGGPVMLILFGLSIFALAIIFVKTYQFIASQLGRTEFIDKAIISLQENQEETSNSFIRQRILEQNDKF